MTREIQRQCDVYGNICLVNKLKTNSAQENIPGCKILQRSTKRDFEVLDCIIR